MTLARLCCESVNRHIHVHIIQCKKKCVKFVRFSATDCKRLQLRTNAVMLIEVVLCDRDQRAKFLCLNVKLM